MLLVNWVPRCVAALAFLSPVIAAAQGGMGPNAGAPKAAQITLPRGTRLLVRLSTPLSTASQRAGTRFHARLVSDLRADGALVAPAGSPVLGELTRSSGGHKGGVQRLQATLLQISYRGDLVDVVTDTLKVESVRDEPARNAGTGTVLGVQLDRGGETLVALLDQDSQLTIPSGSRAELRLLRPLTVWK